MKELLRQKTYQGALSKVNSPLDPSFKLRQLKYVSDIFNNSNNSDDDDDDDDDRDNNNSNELGAATAVICCTSLESFCGLTLCEDAKNNAKFRKKGHEFNPCLVVKKKVMHI